MSEIYIKKAFLKDLDQVMEIIDHAKKLLKEDGSTQWQDKNPSKETLETDIKKGFCYLLIVGNEIAGTATLMTGTDPNYFSIEGKWINELDPYSTIHRVAISNKFRGLHLSKYFFSNLISTSYGLGIKNIRIDTHEMNIRMQKLIQEFGFSYTGVIYVSPSPEGKRNAYELNLN